LVHGILMVAVVVVKSNVNLANNNNVKIDNRKAQLLWVLGPLNI
jgi:hypothetical protein